jgi:hypothetical protein
MQEKQQTPIALFQQQVYFIQWHHSARMQEKQKTHR